MFNCGSDRNLGGFHPILVRQPTSTWSPLRTPIQTSIIGDPEQSTILSNSPKDLTSNEIETVTENILPGLLNHSISRTQTEKKDLILREVECLMLERYKGELADRTNKILDSSSPQSFAQFIAFVSNLSSNNLIEDVQQQKAFLEWVRQEHRSFLQMMFSIKTPAMQACLEALLSYTVTANDSASFKALFEADKLKQWYRGRREMLLLPAVRFDLINVVRVICDEGTYVNCQLSLTPWDHGPKSPLGAATTEEMAWVLLGAGANLKSDVYSRESSNILVCKALERGEVELAELLVKAGACYDPMQRTSRDDRRTQLAYAIYAGHFSAVIFMLRMGAVCIDGPICYYDGRSWATELQLAAFHGYQGIVTAILNTPSGKDCISTGHYRWAPLRDASMQGHVEIVKLLISAGADVNAGQKIHVKDFYEYHPITSPSTPLMAAVVGGHKEVVQVLLLESVNVNGLDFSIKGTSALEAAEKLELFDIALLLLMSGAVHNPERDRREQKVELCFAARTNNFERVRYLVTRGVDVSYILDAAPARPDGTTCSNIISLFLELCGDRINTLGPSSRRSALQIAMEANQSAIARRLVLAGASLFTPWSFEGGCPLNCAIENQDFSMINYLVSRGANIKHPFASSNMDILFGFGDFGGLIEKGVDLPLAEWLANVLPRQLATNNISLTSTRQLIEFGADVNSAAGDYGTPLQTAAGANVPLSIIQLLIERGADINAKAGGTSGKIALQAAIVPWSFHQSCNLAPKMETIQYLLEFGADVNCPTSGRQGVTALQGAAIRGCLKIAHMLLERGADPNAAGSQQGRTALEGAAENGRLDMVQLLLNAGAHATENAACAAEWNNHLVISDLIRENIKEDDTDEEDGETMDVMEQE